MTEQNRSDELIRLTYCSTANFESMEKTNGVELEVARILMESRRNNPKKEIGGVLHYGNGFFFQALEGKRKDVNERYEKIVKDPRHRDVELLVVHPVGRRLFPDWSMKYVAVETRISDLLKKHGKSAFKPYEFNEAFCEELIQCFVEQADASNQEDMQASSPNRINRQPGNRKPDPAPARKSLWGRLFGTR